MSTSKQPSTTYSFKPGEPIPAGVKRIALEMVDRALWQLTTPDNDKDKAVHDARKCCKKTRAVLRLIRDEIGQKAYTRENAIYRDAARELSAMRSSAVMAETLEALRTRFADELKPDAFAACHAGLMTMHHAAIHETIEAGNLLSEVAATITSARDRLAKLPVKKDDFSTLSGGLKRVYRRGRHAMKTAYADPSTENFHEWRKRVKYLRYQLRIIRPWQLDILGPLADDLDALSDLLGLDHDLAELRAVVSDHPEFFASKKELKRLHALIDRYRPELQAEAHALGERIYAERPKVFVRRLKGYYSART